MTSFLGQTTHGRKILIKTLQNRIIKETFAKKRMSKARSVQKKMRYGRTDRQTDRQTDRRTDLSINYIGIGTSNSPIGCN